MTPLVRSVCELRRGFSALRRGHVEFARLYLAEAEALLGDAIINALGYPETFGRCWKVHLLVAKLGKAVVS